MNEEIITTAGIQFGVYEIAEHYQLGERYIFKYKKVFKLDYSNNCGYFLKEIKPLRIEKNELPYTLRGKYVMLRRDQANKLVGHNYFTHPD